MLVWITINNLIVLVPMNFVYMKYVRERNKHKHIPHIPNTQMSNPGLSGHALTACQPKLQIFNQCMESNYNNVRKQNKQKQQYAQKQQRLSSQYCKKGTYQDYQFANEKLVSLSKEMRNLKTQIQRFLHAKNRIRYNLGNLYRQISNLKVVIESTKRRIQGTYSFQKRNELEILLLTKSQNYNFLINQEKTFREDERRIQKNFEILDATFRKKNRHFNRIHHLLKKERDCYAAKVEVQKSIY